MSKRTLSQTLGLFHAGYRYLDNVRTGTELEGLSLLIDPFQELYVQGDGDLLFHGCFGVLLTI